MRHIERVGAFAGMAASPRRRRGGLLLASLCAVLLLAACGHAPAASTAGALPSPTATVAPTATPELLPDGEDWTQYRFDLAGTGNNPENYITSATSAKLKLAWTATGGSFLSTPAIVDGVVYAVTHESLHAYDLLTGALKWQSPDLAEGVAVNSSVAVDVGLHLAFFGTASARVAAIDTDTGAIRWNTQLADPKAGAYIWSSPLLANNMLYIGLASQYDAPCVRGTVWALDPATGIKLWTHYTVPAGMLGGAVWSSITADPTAQQLLVTTGNPCPEGLVTYESDAILALNWNNGTTKWIYTAVHDDIGDYDFGEGAVHYTLNGQEYIVAGNKFGAVYAIKPPAPGGQPTLAWTLRPAHSGYLGSGGVFQPPAYQNGLVFVAFGPTWDGDCPTGALYAFHGDTGAVAWRDCTPSQAVGAGAISGDLLFIPFTNTLIGYNTSTGQIVWSAKQNGETWGGVAISRGFLVSGTLGSVLYCYGLPLAGRLPQS